jgi:DNA-binding transcriptional LysR family regulator
MTFRFDLVDLRLFLNVVEAGSITAGAERTHLALASASARILGMEESLGTVLLTRARRGVHPTPAGRALLQHARTILTQMEHMRGELGDYAKGLKGRIRLLCNTVSMTEYLPDRLGEFLAAHSNVDISVEEQLSHDIVRAVAEGAADLGIVTASTETVGLETVPFLTDRLVLVVPVGHPLVALARQRPIEIPDADPYDAVGLIEGSALQAQRDEAAARRGVRLKYRVRLRSFDDLSRVIGHGVGVAVMPATAAARAAAALPVAVLPLNERFAVRPLVLCARRFDELPAYAKRLVEHLGKSAGDDAD